MILAASASGARRICDDWRDAEGFVTSAGCFSLATANRTTMQGSSAERGLCRTACTA